MTDDAAKPKITARATDRDPFGLDDFTKGDLGSWFPGGVVPPSGVPGSKAAPPPTSGLLAPQGAPAGAGTLGAYRKMQEAGGAREAAGARPPLPPSVATSPIVHPQGAPQGAPTAAQTAPTPWTPSPEPPPPTAADLIAGEMKLQLLRGMFPQHSITPVEYDPWKAVPQGLGAKVNVNEGIA